MFCCSSKGRSQSFLFQKREMEILVKSTLFNEKELRDLKRQQNSKNYANIILKLFKFRDSMGILGLDSVQLLSDRIFHIMADPSGKNFIVYLNTIMNGDEKEKIIISFRLIDEQNRGYFTKEDLALMIKSIVNSWAALTQTSLSSTLSLITLQLTVYEAKEMLTKMDAQIDHTFQVMDIRKQGKVRKEDFIEASLKYPDLLEIFEFLNKGVSGTVTTHQENRVIEQQIEKDLLQLERSINNVYFYLAGEYQENVFLLDPLLNQVFKFYWQERKQNKSEDTFLGSFSFDLVLSVCKGQSMRKKSEQAGGETIQLKTDHSNHPPFEKNSGMNLQIHEIWRLKNLPENDKKNSKQNFHEIENLSNNSDQASERGQFLTPMDDERSNKYQENKDSAFKKEQMYEFEEIKGDPLLFQQDSAQFCNKNPLITVNIDESNKIAPQTQEDKKLPLKRISNYIMEASNNNSLMSFFPTNLNRTKQTSLDQQYKLSLLNSMNKINSTSRIASPPQCQSLQGNVNIIEEEAFLKRYEGIMCLGCVEKIQKMFNCESLKSKRKSSKNNQKNKTEDYIDSNEIIPKMQGDELVNDSFTPLLGIQEKISHERTHREDMSEGGGNQGKMKQNDTKKAQKNENLNPTQQVIRTQLNRIAQKFLGDIDEIESFCPPSEDEDLARSPLTSQKYNNQMNSHIVYKDNNLLDVSSFENGRNKQQYISNKKKIDDLSNKLSQFEEESKSSYPSDSNFISQQQQQSLSPLGFNQSFQIQKKTGKIVRQTPNQNAKIVNQNIFNMCKPPKSKGDNKSEILINSEDIQLEIEGENEGIGEMQETQRQNQQMLNSKRRVYVTHYLGSNKNSFKITPLEQRQKIIESVNVADNGPLNTSNKRLKSILEIPQTELQKQMNEFLPTRPNSFHNQRKVSCENQETLPQIRQIPPLPPSSSKLINFQQSPEIYSRVQQLEGEKDRSRMESSFFIDKQTSFISGIRSNRNKMSCSISNEISVNKNTQKQYLNQDQIVSNKDMPYLFRSQDLSPNISPKNKIVDTDVEDFPQNSKKSQQNGYSSNNFIKQVGLTPKEKPLQSDQQQIKMPSLHLSNSRPNIKYTLNSPKYPTQFFLDQEKSTHTFSKVVEMENDELIKRVMKTLLIFKDLQQFIHQIKRKIDQFFPSMSENNVSNISHHNNHMRRASFSSDFKQSQIGIFVNNSNIQLGASPISKPLSAGQKLLCPLQYQKSNSFTKMDPLRINKGEETLRNSTIFNIQKGRHKEKKELRKQKSMVFIGHQNWNLVVNMMMGIQMSVQSASSNCQLNQTNTEAELQNRDFKVKYLFELLPRKENFEKQWAYKVCKFKDYAPAVFNKIRGFYNISNEEYLKSIGPNQLFSLVKGGFNSFSQLTSTGKSGSFFYYTADGQFTLKTVSSSEFHHLKIILKNYYEHLKENRNSLIIKFFGLHKIQIRMKQGRKVETIYIVIMRNIFHTNKLINERYDLKGSTYGRSTKDKIPGVTQKDLDFLENKSKILVKFDEYEEFMSVVKKDAQFFEENNIIDYSMLVGIHYLPVHNQDQSDQISQTIIQQFPLGGIKDVSTFVSRNSTKKKFEYLAKRVAFGPNISAIPPSQYKQRFISFMDQMFDEDSKVSPYLK